MGEKVEFAAKSIDDLGLPPEVSRALKDVQAEIADSYRESFIELLGMVRQQSSALERIQITLGILVEAMRPTLTAAGAAGHLPTPFKLAKEGERPDVASALVVADPISAGYMMSQAELAKAVRLPQTDVSILVRAFKLTDDGDCAVHVRQGGRGPAMVNYHPRAA